MPLNLANCSGSTTVGEEMAKPRCRVGGRGACDTSDFGAEYTEEATVLDRPISKAL
jgi:hypothetical protein